MPRCPTCAAEVDLVAGATAPFCSERCRLVDLGRWLTESYSVAVPRAEDDESEDDAPGTDVDVELD